MDVAITVLGPVGATVDGRPAALGGPRRRALLATLVAAAGETVEAERLLDEVWAGRRTPGVGTLHFYVSTLRSALEPARGPGEAPRVVVRRASGYALDLPPGAVDAERFTVLAADGAAALTGRRAEQALPLLDAALALWHGPAYADVADLGVLAPEVARLTELRLGAQEDRLAALLERGRAGEAAAAAGAHVRRHPLRERGWELRIRALHRQGRRAEALADLKAVRALLAGELGLDPGPALQAAEREVLTAV
ncbi:AfsR/SARP family transcriptional regulator [Pseudonocardia halophobica]|uniref:AfsR/SARP family transcriptional regulator n=1 Tax=Pseudonocardia halophobica TaxID=29401 RepID=UPI003D8A760D